MNKLLNIIYTTVLISTLTACGGGGTSNLNTNDNITNSGGTNNSGGTDTPTGSNESTSNPNTNTPNTALSSHVRLKKMISTDGSGIGTTTYEYDSKNRANKIISVFSNLSHQETGRNINELEYDAANNLIKITTSGSTAYTEYVPSADNKHIQKEIHYAKYNNVVIKQDESEVAERDDSGRPTLVKGKNYDSDGSGSVLGTSNIYYTYENGDLTQTKSVYTSYNQNGTSVGTTIRKNTYDLAHQPPNLHLTGNYPNFFEGYPKHHEIKTELTSINPDGTVTHDKLLISTVFNQLDLPETSNLKFYNADVLTSETNIKYEYENAN